MNHKNRTFTRHQDSKRHRGPFARIRTAIAGDEQLFDEMMAASRAGGSAGPDAAFVAHAAFLARAS